MSARLSEEDGYAIELGIAEVLTNIVMHGYAPHENGFITVSWEAHKSGLIMQIVDTGLPIPPHLLARKSGHAFDFDPHDVVNLPENGFGLALVRSIFDAMDYESLDGVNHLRLQRCRPE